MKTVDELENEVERLFSKQKRFRFFAFSTAVSGLIFFLFGLTWKWFHPEWSLENMGSFLAGGAGAAWGFSGLLFIYLGFLGQKQEIKNQQIELILTRSEMEASREELRGQKEQLAEQKNALDKQTDALLNQVITLQREMDFNALNSLKLAFLEQISMDSYGRAFGLHVLNYLNQANEFVINSNLSGSFHYYIKGTKHWDHNGQLQFEEISSGFDLLANRIFAMQYMLCNSSINHNQKVIILSELSFQFNKIIPRNFKSTLEKMNTRDESGMPLEKYSCHEMKVIRYYYRAVKSLWDEYDNLSPSIFDDIADYPIHL